MKDDFENIALVSEAVSKIEVTQTESIKVEVSKKEKKFNFKSFCEEHPIQSFAACFSIAVFLIAALGFFTEYSLLSDFGVNVAIYAEVNDFIVMGLKHLNVTGIVLGGGGVTLILALIVSHINKLRENKYKKAEIIAETNFNEAKNKSGHTQAIDQVKEAKSNLRKVDNNVKKYRNNLTEAKSNLDEARDEHSEAMRKFKSIEAAKNVEKYEANFNEANDNFYRVSNEKQYKKSCNNLTEAEANLCKVENEIKEPFDEYIKAKNKATSTTRINIGIISFAIIMPLAVAISVFYLIPRNTKEEINIIRSMQFPLTINLRNSDPI